MHTKGFLGYAASQEVRFEAWVAVIDSVLEPSSGASDDDAMLRKVSDQTPFISLSLPLSLSLSLFL